MPVETIRAPGHSRDRTRSLGWLAVDWIEALTIHGPGDIQGRPLSGDAAVATPLTTELASLTLDAYALDEDGARLYDSVFYSRAKGCNKSGMAAWIALFEAFGPCRFAGFAEGGEVAFEPKGPTGPDLRIRVGDTIANVEIKRLLDGPHVRPTEDLEAWYDDETDPHSVQTGEDRLTDKVRGVIVDAARQLPRGEANAIVLSDWSVSVTRGNFRRAAESLAAEIAPNGTYGRISAVEYESNFLGSTNNYLWRNRSADVPLSEEVERMLSAAAAARSRRFRKLWSR